MLIYSEINTELSNVNWIILLVNIISTNYLSQNFKDYFYTMVFFNSIAQSLQKIAQ